VRLGCGCLDCSVDETYEQVKENETDQILRNKALIIDEIESTVSLHRPHCDAVLHCTNTFVAGLPSTSAADRAHQETGDRIEY
jgi:hypothetical protein